MRTSPALSFWCCSSFATIGYVEDAGAGNAVAALAASPATYATVLRNGDRAALPAAERVLDDSIHVKLGDMGPADVRVVGDAAAALDDPPLGGDDGDMDAGVAPSPPPPPLPAAALEVDQAGLTGKLMREGQRVGAPAYSGSVVQPGEALAVVVPTGGRMFLFLGEAAGSRRDRVGRRRDRVDDAHVDGQALGGCHWRLLHR